VVSRLSGLISIATAALLTAVVAAAVVGVSPAWRVSAAGQSQQEAAAPFDVVFGWGSAAGAAAPQNSDPSSDEMAQSPPDHVQLAQAQPPAPPSPQSAPAHPAPQAQPAPAPAQHGPSPTSAQQSDAEVVLTLVRSTLVALHQANVTGNYTVLRDLAAPGFRDKNSAADLARIFASIRDAKIDLSGVVLLDPHITRPTLNDQKMLDIAGSLETKPVPVNYELLFQPIQGEWRIFGIAVTPVQLVGASNAPSPLTSSTKQPSRTAKPSKPAPQKPAPKPGPGQ
jgi:hypothetical protein